MLQIDRVLFYFFYASSPSGKGAADEPSLPPEISGFKPPLPLGISLRPVATFQVFVVAKDWEKS